MRKIAVVTGTRAEYSYLRPLMRKINESSELKLLVYVTGMHLLKEYGNTIDEIIKDGFKIDKKIDMMMKFDNTLYDMAISIGQGICGFANVLKEDKPDILIVFGDRVEAFAAAIAAAAMGIPIGHINGGDVGQGEIDNDLRHAITKLSHLHFTASNKSTERVLKLGEEKWRVFHVGSLSLDTIFNIQLLSKMDLCKKYSLKDKNLILLLYHPNRIEWVEAADQMKLVVNAVATVAAENDLEIIILYPNAYPGGAQIIGVIREFLKTEKNVKIFENLPHIDYLSLLKASSVFIGNSSSGIIEAPSLGVPYVCIGTRQLNRERANNVIDVGYNKKEIIEGLRKALFDVTFINLVKKRESPYGDGKTSEKIVKILSEIQINKDLMQKKLTY